MKLTGESKILLAILAATLAIIGVAVFLFTKPAHTQKPLSKEALIAVDSHRAGNASASAYLVEFSDFQCPACAAFAPAVNQLVKKNTEKLLFVYRHYPLSQHAFAKPAALAAEAAGQQGKFWEMANLLFSNQDRFSTAPWGDLAGQLNLDRTKFDAAIQSETLKAKIDRDEAAAIQLGLPGTPSFFLNGVRLAVTNPIDLQKAVEEAIR